MFNGKYTHINEIIERVYRDYALEEFYNDEAKEWVWDCIGYFGRDEVMQDKILDITIENGRGILPVDLHTFIGCRETNSKIPLLPTKNRFITTDFSSTTNSIGQVIVQGRSVNLETPGVGENVVDQVDPQTVFVDIIPNETIQDTTKYLYYLNNNYIYTGIANGTITIAYKAFPMWEDYTPMVPDDPKVIRMVALHIAEKIAFRMYRLGKLQRAVWQDIKDELEWAVGSAQNRIKMPNEDEMESIRRQQMRLIPKPDRWNENFGTINNNERIKRM